MWHPNVQKKTYCSNILGVYLKLHMTTAAMRWIDKAGGFDSYIYHTPDRKLTSELGVDLKRRMHAIVNKWKNHFYKMKGDVGMSGHEKERKQEDAYTKIQTHS